jgi:uncharacterized metal-binding protein
VKKEKVLVYSCSGCSSAAQMANWMAVAMDRRGFAEMSCIAGIGGGVKSLVTKARHADRIIGLDGCKLACVMHCLQRESLHPDFYYDLSDYGVPKKSQQEFDRAEAETIVRLIVQDIRGKMIADEGEVA